MKRLVKSVYTVMFMADQPTRIPERTLSRVGQTTHSFVCDNVQGFGCVAISVQQRDAESKGQFRGVSRV